MVSKSISSKRHCSKRHGSKRHGSKRETRSHKCSHVKCNKLNGGSPCIMANYTQLMNNDLANQCDNEHKYNSFKTLLDQYSLELKNANGCNFTDQQISQVKQSIDQCNKKKPFALSGPLQYPTGVISNPVYATKNKYLHNRKKSKRSSKLSGGARRRSAKNRK